MVEHSLSVCLISVSSIFIVEKRSKVLNGLSGPLTDQLFKNVTDVYAEPPQYGHGVGNWLSDSTAFLHEAVSCERATSQ